MLIRVTITERPKIVTVEYNKQTHTANWSDSKNFKEVKGDLSLLKAAVLVWKKSQTRNLYVMDDNKFASLCEGLWVVSP